MVLVIFSGVISILSVTILTLNEIRNHRIFKGMPKIRMEKREVLCIQMLPFLESAESKNKKMAERMGWTSSGIFMGYLRVLAFLMSFAIGGLIILTNNVVLRDEIIRNMSMGKSFVDLQSGANIGTDEIKDEIKKIRILESQIPEAIIRKGGEELSTSIRTLQGQWNGTCGEAQNEESKRLTVKIVKLYTLKTGMNPWIELVLVSLVIYLFPIPLGWIRGGLLEQKKREEIIRLYETLLLYGELPPYEIRSLLVNITNTALLYKSILGKVMEGVKAGYGEKTFEEAIKNAGREKDWGFVDLLEHLKSFYLSGVLSKDKDIERIINRKIKLEEICYEKRRGSKIQMASVPLGIIVGLGTWYFMLGTMSLSNMSILGR